jgi:hypothetical protein
LLKLNFKFLACCLLSQACQLQAHGFDVPSGLIRHLDCKS